jgi:ssDNA-binding replication factor A large subunit
MSSFLRMHPLDRVMGGFIDIAALRIGQRALVKGRITEKGSVREFKKFGRIGRVCECMLSDKGGEIKLVLWDEQIERFQEGEEVEVAVYTKEYKGEMQLNVLRVNES